MNNSEYKQKQAKLEEGLESAKEKLSNIKNVLAVGIGFKEANNELTDEVAYRVYVPVKKNLASLSPNEIIPSIIDGIKTDVLTPLIVTNDSDVCGNDRLTLSEHRPLKAGIAISTDSINVGTLGWFGTLSDGTTVLLTNKHVLYGYDEGIDLRKLKTAQPQLGDPSKCCCCTCGSDNVIGEAIIGIRDENPANSTSVDCAIAKINADLASTIVFHITNDSTTEVLSVRGVANPAVGQKVRKIGARSGYTRGKIIHLGDVAVVIQPPDDVDSAGTPIKRLVGQVLILPDPAETYQVKEGGVCKFAFSNSGDSGAVIINETNEIVALNWNGDRTTNNVAITIAANIQNVLAKLSANGFPVTLSVSPAGGDRESVKADIFKKTASGINQNILEKLRDSNKQSLIFWLYEKHQKEVIELVNHARLVMVAWQRHQGPAFVAAIARAAREEHYRIPEEINGVNRTQLLLAMKEALILSGSAALQEDIVRYESAILQSATRGDTIGAIAEHLLAAGLIDRITSHESPAIT